MKLGVIGIDSSHLPEFTRRIKALHEAGQTACHVVACWTDNRHDLPEADVAKWLEATGNMGVTLEKSLDAMLDSVDGAMVLSVNGNRHLEHAAPALQRGLPTYIDKPLTCDLGQARQLLELSHKHRARCYSASSLRFAAEVQQVRDADLGDLVAIDAFGPGELNPSMEGLFFYGVHTIEMVDAIWGPGVSQVAAEHAQNRDTVRLRYKDGRFAQLRLDRAGSYAFGATVHGTKAARQFVVDFADVYNRLIKGMVGFFEGGPAPARMEDLVENVAVMEAGNRSMAAEGKWSDLDL